MDMNKIIMANQIKLTKFKYILPDNPAFANISNNFARTTAKNNFKTTENQAQ